MLGAEVIATRCRKLALQAIYNAQSGHPGGSLSIADILAVLYFEEMGVRPQEPDCLFYDVPLP